MTDFGSVFRHLVPPAAAAAPAASSAPLAAAPAPAPARGGGGFGTILGGLAALGALAFVIKGSKDADPLERFEAELQDDDGPGPVVVETTGEVVEEPAPAPAPCPSSVVPLEVVRMREAATWGPRPTRPPPHWATDPELWRTATAAVRARWGEHARPWAVVAHVYHSLGGRMA